MEAHFGGHQAGRGLRGREQREPARVLVGRDPPQLAGMHREQGLQRGLRAGEGGVGGLEQRRLAGRAADGTALAAGAAVPRSRAQAPASVAGSSCRPSLASSRVSVSATS